MSFKKFANNILFNRLSLKKIILKFFLKFILKIFLEEKKSNPLWKKIFDIDLKDVFFRKLNEKNNNNNNNNNINMFFVVVFITYNLYHINKNSLHWVFISFWYSSWNQADWARNSYLLEDLFKLFFWKNIFIYERIKKEKESKYTKRPKVRNEKKKRTQT